MNNNFQRTADWLRACGKTPDTPGALSVQIGCDIEETLELLACLRIDPPNLSAAIALERAVLDLLWVSGHLKRGESTAYIPDDLRAEALDALCDREVTGNGIAYLASMDKRTADELVLDSNDAKLIGGKPVLLEGGKIGKPDGWRAPDFGLLV